jgi:hypothetical protein
MSRRSRAEGTRAPNGASSIYFGKDGKWHGRVTMGVLDNGEPDRRHVERKTESEVIDGVRELERQRDAGQASEPWPRADHDEWKALLAEAQVRDARLHDARHTAATMLLVLKVSLPAIMEIMGWSDAAVAKRYMRVPNEVVAGIANQVGAFLWDDDASKSDVPPPGQHDAAALIDQLQRLLDAAKASPANPDDE